MCRVALPCCLFDLACFFLPSFSSLIKTCIYLCVDVLGSYRATPCRRVLATAVRAPLSLSLSLFSFSFPVGYLQTMTEPALHSQVREYHVASISALLSRTNCSGESKVTLQFVQARERAWKSRLHVYVRKYNYYTS